MLQFFTQIFNVISSLFSFFTNLINDIISFFGMVIHFVAVVRTSFQYLPDEYAIAIGVVVTFSLVVSIIHLGG